MSGAGATYIAGFLRGIADVIASGIDGAGWKFAYGEWDAERQRYILAASGQKANARPSVNAALGSLRGLGARTSQDGSVEVGFTSAALLLGEHLAGTTKDCVVSVKAMLPHSGDEGTVTLSLPYSAVSSSGEGWIA